MNVLNAYAQPLFNVTYSNPWEAIYQHESARVERFLGRRLDSPELVAEFADAELRRFCEMSGQSEVWDVAVSSRRTFGELDLMRWNDEVIAEQITALEVMLRTRAERLANRWGAVESPELASELLSPMPSLLDNERERDALAQLWAFETDVATVEDQATGLTLSEIRARFLTDLRAPEVFETSPQFAGELYFSGSDSGEFSPRA